MKAEESKVQFDDFMIVKVDMAFKIPQDIEKEINPEEIMKKYHIDFDYGFRRHDKSLYMFVKIGINRQENPMEGYIIFCEGVGILEPPDLDSLTSKERQDIKVLALSYGINQLRGYLTNLTSFGSFGAYLLPILDLKDIIVKKQKEINKGKDEEETEPLAKKS